MSKSIMDSKCFQCPPQSKDYRDFWSRKSDSSKKNKNNKYRPDGERDKDSSVRPLFCEVGVLTQCKGSAYIERGRTKVIASVFGPREVNKKLDFSSTTGILSVEYCETPFSSSSSNRSSKSPSNEDKNISLFLAQTFRSTVCLHLYPKSRIDIFITVLENDGSAIPTAITAGALALSDASINLFDLVIGASVKMSLGKALIDPCKAEEEVGDMEDAEDNRGNIIIGYQPSLEQIAALLQDGVLEQSVLSAQIRDLIKVAKGNPSLYSRVPYSFPQ
uniref:Exosome complex exonuclease MTR3 n=1 Tax=Caligus clemensi TaxID=344056 RepID=C1C2V7_CALCM|nr:Exosome complex exonuclease MTR3 [Caligus clemensi]